MKQSRSCNLLPLTTTRTISSQNQDAIAASPGFLGMADELVSFDKRLAIFKKLASNDSYFYSVEHARSLARFAIRSAWWHWMEQELRTGGSYAGGANRQNNSILSSWELEQFHKKKLLKKQVCSEEATLKTLQDEMVRLTESLEAIKSQGRAGSGPGARLVPRLSTNQSSSGRVRNVLWKLQEELNRLLRRLASRQETPRATCYHCQWKSKIWKLRLKKQV